MPPPHAAPAYHLARCVLGWMQTRMERRTCMPTIGIVGVGLIGRAWANVFARAGWDVRLWDPDAAALAAAPG